MPDCPDCGTELGVWERGTVCPTCKRVFNKIETSALPGYDREAMHMAYTAYKVMFAAGLLHHGENKLTFFDDGFSIEHKHEEF